MKLNRIFWGILFLFVGAVLLLQNLNLIHFYWRHLWNLWPVFLIIWGVRLAFNHDGKQIGSMMAIGILVISLGVLFVKGQQKPHFGPLIFTFDNGIGEHQTWSDEDNTSKNTSYFNETLLPTDSTKKGILNISGGGVSFELSDTTDSLFEAKIKRNRGNFSLTKLSTDSSNILNFSMDSKKLNRKDNWNFNTGGTSAEVKLNALPEWTINLSMGAGNSEFDLSSFKVREFNFDGGASNVELKLGDLLPECFVNIKTGVANIEIQVPENVGCRINTKTGLSAKEFDNFKKVSSNIYETSNFNTAKKKIYLNLDGGLSNFEVSRY